ncbi:MAG: replication-associated recombination protein A [Clostridia bacterium]|nr:replication-associated recombination protein A [Clostridia bacterium]MBQ3063108.1 replication-associated recombination protein A [Clostridia bacterium]
MYQPLADKIRPTELDDVIGQTHIIGENGILRRIIESGAIPNMIFYGPSGIGKTTLAQIIAGKTKRRLYKLNATTASVNDIKAIVSELDTLLAPNGILLYLDEIQYFNKKQQQSLLEFIESGKITLIASTTENPYFYVYNAILSRSTVFEFKPITPKEVEKAIRRAFTICARDNKKKIILEEGVVEHISFACGGDVRKSINAVELLCSAGSHNDEINVTLEDTKIVTQKSSARYDRDGDAHYDILSAFHKSLRGSDVNASLHYLARLLCGGDIASAARRMLCVASEDVGLAYPQAAAIVKACCDSALQLGLPEAKLPLAEACILLATAPKSNSVSAAIEAAMADVEAGRTGDVPAHLKDAHYGGAQKLGRGLTYKYPHDYPGNWISQQYLPDELKKADYYKEGINKAEQQAKQYWQKVKNND